MDPATQQALLQASRQVDKDGWSMTARVLGAIGLGVPVLALSAAAVWADQAPGATTKHSSAASVYEAASDRVAYAAAIAVTVWKADDTPLPRARLRLRDALTGRIEATGVADETGRFTFTVSAGGTYIVEVVAENGKVLALGQTVSVARGETVAVFIRLGTRDRWFETFFNNAAAAAISTAASTGIMAVAPDTVRAVSPQR
jgi:hypothetical protein